MAVVLAAFAWSNSRIPEAEARAFAFATLVVSNLALILSNRSGIQPLWRTLQRPNRVLWLVFCFACGLLATALYLPWAVDVLRFAPLPLHELVLACGLGSLGVLWFEAVKWSRRHLQSPQT